MLTARCGFVLPFFLSAFCMVLPLKPALAQDVGVVVRTVQSEQIADPLEALGTLKPNEFVTVTANVAETIEAILFESGQRVAQGAVLARLESAEEQAVLQEARYTVDEAESQLERIRAVAKRGDASQSLLDEKQREFYVARARLAATSGLFWWSAVTSSMGAPATVPPNSSIAICAATTVPSPATSE